ncbi:MAG: GAF domain-containing protein, partial [Lentisphaerae bacterium]
MFQVMEKKQLQFLSDISALSRALYDSQDLTEYLKQVVRLICRHTNAAVCSLYLYDEFNAALKLVVTEGLNTEVAENLFIDITQGLVGRCFRTREIIVSDKASEEEDYYYIPGLNEEDYDCFCAVPLSHADVTFGVLVTQRPQGQSFSETEVLALHAVALQLADHLEHARFSLHLEKNEDHNLNGASLPFNRLLNAHGVSPGLAIGPSLNWDRYRSAYNPLEPAHLVADHYTLEDFERALAKTEEELREMEEKLTQHVPEMVSMIFGAHLIILKDRQFSPSIRELIEEGVPVSEAIHKVGQKFIQRFQTHSNPTIRERVVDIRDIVARLIHNLSERHHITADRIAGHIIFAREIYPSDVVRFAFQDVAGIISAEGGDTAHTSILARSFKLPMAICDDPLLSQLPEDTMLILDAQNGKIFLKPDDDLLTSYQHKAKTSATLDVQHEPLSKQLKSGETIKVMANINIFAEVEAAQLAQADGIGLYRSEFPFLVRSDLPSELDQLNIYHQIIEKMEALPIHFRTLDIGGDKALHYLAET